MLYAAAAAARYCDVFTADNNSVFVHFLLIFATFK